MNIYTLDIPVCKEFCLILKTMNKKVTFLENPIKQMHLFQESTDLLQSLFILPLHLSKDSWQQTELFTLAESLEIPILFIYKRSKEMTNPPSLPKRTYYHTLPIPADPVEVKIKLTSLQNISMHLFSFKMKGQELEKINQKSESSFRIAKKFQHLCMPVPIRNNQIEINGLSQPSTELSGDLFYWTEVSDGKYAFIMVDMCGKGIHTALIHMSIRTLIPELLKRVSDPIIITKELNKHMKGLVQGMHKEDTINACFSAFIAYVNTKDRLIEYVNCGHPPAITHAPHTNLILKLSEGAAHIGLIPDMPIKKIVFQYDPGSRFIIYSDGLSKTPNPSAADRTEGIEKEFIENAHLSTHELLQQLLLSRMRHSEIDDDINIIVGTLF
ncbi:PP2C family protein-serine/threonine phosphatase [Peribacillus muralis]|uniref:PP2C family protein-serine/threonine phosphatase n=1 Tax=Peribacillus muralis TaxID=264697 RepID=UPI00070D4868|nr:PP2C family protein-serine/threonine phosphatase [Peribacillus muralis]